MSFRRQNKSQLLINLSVALTLVGLIGVAALFTALPARAAAGINPQVNFQGRLLNAAGAVVPDGAYNLEFKLYTGGTGCVSSGSSPCGGTNVWTEDWVYGSGAPDNRVIVRNGYFSVQLGALSTLSGIDFNNDTLWTSINIGNTTTAATFGAASGDGEMLPFKRLTSSPYAFNAGKLGGLAATSFLQLAQGVQGDASTTNASLFINKTGITASILDLQRGGADVLLVNNSGQALFRPTVNSATALQVQQAGTATTIFTVDSTNARIGIGTGAPAYAVDAVGSVNASVSLKVAGTDVCTTSGCIVDPTSGIQNQTASPQTAGFNIDGNGTIGGTLAVGGDISFSDGVNHTISINTPTMSNTTGDNLILAAGTGSSGFGAGGVLELHGGTGGTNASGGALTITGGNSTGSTTNGGNVTISGGVKGSLGGTPGSVIIKPQASNDSATAFQVQNAAGNNIFSVDTSGNQIVLGKPGGSGITGQIQFANSTNANTVTFTSGVTSATYQLTLPTALGASGDCLKDTTGAGVLGFGSCGGGSSSLQGAYTGSAGATPSIAVNTTNKAVTIQNSITSGIAAGNEYFGIRATGASDVVLGNSLFTVNSTGVGINIGGTGNPATTADLSFGSGANRTINVITQTAGNTAGNNLSLTAATGNGTGTGGALALNGGTGGSGTTGNGGATTVTGGNAASTNGSGGSVTISGGTKTGSGTGGSVIVKPQASNDSATAFQVQNATGNGLLSVDTTGSQTVLGKAGAGGIDGKLVFNNAAGANTVTLQAPGSNPASSFALILPTTAGNANECIKNTATPGTLTYGTCGGGTSSMQGAYDGSTTTNPQILLSSTNGGIKIQDGTTPVTGNLLQIGPNGSTTTAYLGISATAFTLQDTAGNNALVFDSTTSHLKVYENIASPTRFADIYYDNATSSAIFAASSGITQVGTGAGGGGNINLVLTGTADQLLTSKTNTLAAAYSINDFKFTRNLTGGAYAVTGNVMTVEDLTTFSGGSSAPNVLYVNQNNTSATGNLILAQTGGGANDKFKVTTAGNATLAGGVTIGSGASYTGAGALTLQSGAGTALTVTANAASAWSTSSGALTLTSASASTWSTTTGSLTIQAGGANGVILKPGTNSTASTQVQNASGANMLNFDSTNDQISVGVSDTTGTLLVLDTKTDAADPTGVNGGMYYNSNAGRFRCYENSAWSDCLGYRHLITTSSDSASIASIACQNVTGASFPVTSGVTYRFHATIVHTASATTLGVGYGASGPATSLFSLTGVSTLSTGLISGAGNSAVNSCTNVTASSLATTGTADTVDGIIIPSASGTFQLQFSPETATANGIIIKAGSTLEWW